MLPSTVNRVPMNTSPRINASIRERTRQRVTRTVQGGPRQIQCRLAQLDREWDVERVLEANAASASLIGFGLALSVDRRFLALPALVAAFLLQHALQGWCPPLPVLRRLGVRTAAEIDEERRLLQSAAREASPAGEGARSTALDPLESE